MSVTTILVDDKHSIASNLMDTTKDLIINANDSLQTCDAINALLSEMVEITTKHFTGEHVSQNSLDCYQISRNPKEESATSVSNSNNIDDLPVRRSSRIQRLAVQVQKDVKKKSSIKHGKNSKVTTAVEKEESLLVSDTIGENVPLAISSTNNDGPILNESESDCQKIKSEKSKKSNKRVQQKGEKESIKPNEKLKGDTKKTSNRKKKLSSIDLDNSIDQVICDVINSSLNNVNITDNSKAEQEYQPSSSSSNEMIVPEMVQDTTKHDDNQNQDMKDKSSDGNNLKPVKVKSRWWRSSELEGVLNTESSGQDSTSFVSQPHLDENSSTSFKNETVRNKVENESQPPERGENSLKENNAETFEPERPLYEHIEDNIYRFARGYEKKKTFSHYGTKQENDYGTHLKVYKRHDDPHLKKKSKCKKQVRRMVCDCTLTKEEQEYGIVGCKEECLNRLLMIECGYRCPLGEACSNKKFQKKQYVKAQIIKTDKKGWGLRALEDISTGDFLMEFVGEVLNHKEYRQRVKLYAKEKNVHSYFMALKTDEILDATSKGNLTRFINHSCDPNCETQKWTVNGELRVGVFAKRAVFTGEEFTLDYQFQRYGREAQKCLCGTEICSGYIGGAKQISIDAYSVTKSGSSKKKRGSEDKKRDLDDMALEEEIEKLNSSRGLRNREETLKLARLMVRADDSLTRHQLLDIIIKTEEQACLRLFLDYHGLPLMWSWMTDIVDVDLKAKILQVLALLPVSNKTMLLDSKVMSVVEKWVQDKDISKKDDCTNVKNPASVSTSADENSEPLVKKIKGIEFSDSETDSTGSHNANDNSSENSSSITENIFKVETLSGETLSSELSTENKLSDMVQDLKEEQKDDPDLNLKTHISSIGEELLNNWKNLKEVFRIPRLEQQKRKEDELEADHNVLIKTEKKPEVEVTGDHIQVLISAKTPSFSDNIRTYEYDNPEINFKMDDRSRNNLLPVHTTLKKRLPMLPKHKTEEIIQRNLKEESDSSLESTSPVLSGASPIIQPSSRPALLPTPTYINQPPVNFLPPHNPITPHAHLEQAPPQTMYPPPQIVYPQSQVSFVNTAAPPPLITHPPASMPPPSQVVPNASPMLQQPPPTASIPPVNTVLPPNQAGFQLPTNMPPSSAVPPNMPPVSSHFISNQPPTVSNFPPARNPFGNQNQSFYFLQQPPAVPSSTSQATFPENICVQTAASLPAVNSLPIQSLSYPLPSSTSHPIQPTTSLPMQSATSIPIQPTTSQPMQHHTSLPMQPTTSLTIQPTTFLPVEQSSIQSALPVVLEEQKPIKLPKNWRTATDSEGNVYYYHSVTRQTQWDPPTSDQIEDDSDDEEEDSDSEESESSDTPTYDEPKISTKHSRRKSKKRKTTKAAADTSVSFPVRPEVAKKIKELFRTKMSSYIVHCLNAYRKPDCKVGRITSNEDFKYLARKLTHYTMTKELKQCKNVEDLDCNEQVMHKAKDFIKKYMSKYGSKYSRKEKYSPET